MTRFARIELRTTDVDAARAFYAAVLPGGADDVTALPAALRERGVPAHWLGHLGVDDVEAATRAFVALGASLPGPPRPGAPVTVRDPGGAVVALTPGGAPERRDVAWHQLLCGDLERTAAAYAGAFGWRFGPREGAQQRFGWDAGADAGLLVDVAAWPGAHPHWLFHFAVPDLDAAVAEVRARGGVVAAVVDTGGARVAVCEDPQGAAFALRG
ncbi:MAG: VOC family protein [Myxococcota bacterium]